MSSNTKQIMILRHAKAEPEATTGDHARALTTAGERDASELGRHIHDLKLIPQSIYCSSARRALETADRVCEQLFISPGQITVRDELYLADIDNFLSLLQGLNNRVSRVMLVAHNPALEILVDWLSRDPFESDQFSGKRLLPASLVVLEFDGDWASLSQHSCSLTHLIHGKQLTQS